MERSIHEYDDIIKLPRPRSSRHAPMAISERAAQFSPFAALTGYEDIVRETARLTEGRIELAEDEKQRLARSLSVLEKLLCAGHSAHVTVKYFEPDGRKSGGKYVTVSGELRRIDPVGRKLLFCGGRRVCIDDIIKIEIDVSFSSNQKK